MIASFLFIKRINLKIHSIITLTKGLENISLIKQGIFFKEGPKPLKGGNIHAEFVEVVGQKLVQFLNHRENLLKNFLKKTAFFIYNLQYLFHAFLLVLLGWNISASRSGLRLGLSNNFFFFNPIPIFTRKNNMIT